MPIYLRCIGNIIIMCIFVFFFIVCMNIILTLVVYTIKWKIDRRHRLFSFRDDVPSLILIAHDIDYTNTMFV